MEEGQSRNRSRVLRLRIRNDPLVRNSGTGGVRLGVVRCPGGDRWIQDRRSDPRSRNQTVCDEKSGGEECCWIGWRGAISKYISVLMLFIAKRDRRAPIEREKGVQRLKKIPLERGIYGRQRETNTREERVRERRI